MKGLLILVAVASMSLFSGCATLFSSDTKEVNIITNNGEEAKVVINGKHLTTPAKVMLTRSKRKLMLRTITKECAKETAVTSTINTSFLFNFGFGFGFGFLSYASSIFSSAIDYATNKMWSYDDIVVDCYK